MIASELFCAAESLLPVGSEPWATDVSLNLRWTVGRPLREPTLSTVQ